MIDRLIEVVQRELLGRKGLLDDVYEDVQRELCGAVAAVVLRELAVAGDGVEFALNPTGYINELADAIEEAA